MQIVTLRLLGRRSTTAGLRVEQVRDSENDNMSRMSTRKPQI